MNITPTINNYRISRQKSFNTTPCFKRLGSAEYISYKASNGVEYSIRVASNKILDFFQSKNKKNLIKNIANLTPTRNRLFLEQLAEIAKLYGSKKIIDVNIEDKILESIAQNNESAIFIMNHSNQSQDPQMLAVLNLLLAEAYKKNNVEEFPLPKIILNEDILKTMNPTRRKAFENFGAVGIDADVINSDKGVNTKALLPIIKDFIRNKANIFIFPEGRLATRKDLDFSKRFQAGTAQLVNKILGIKKKVTVVPVGFAYGKDDNSNINSMSIGTPIVFKREGENTTSSKGDIINHKESKLYKFFNKEKNADDVVITKNGVPVEKEVAYKFIKAILRENLEINSNIAIKKLNNNIEESEVLLI
ncbi:1-acyl-sn-glycerol-3-phosphate acyltransferase [bacterium]|nr:1-acyl-sn-glycerol-3-phosphate acyltransferase [bacterium]